MSTNRAASPHELKRRRADILKKMKELHAGTQAENRKFTAKEEREFDNLESEIRLLDIEISETVDQKERETEAAAKKRSSPKQNTYLAQVARYLKTGQAQSPEIRALTTTSGSATIIDPLVVDNVIYDLLEDNALIKAGAQYVTIRDNHTQFPKVTAYPTADWVSEGSAITASEPTIDSLKFDFKDIAVLVKVSNILLYDTSVSLEGVVQKTMNEAINNAVLKAAFYGTSGAGQPTGLDTISGVQSVDAGSVVLADYDLFIDSVTALMGANVDPVKISAIMNKDVAGQIAKLKATDDDPLNMPMFVDAMPKYFTQAVKSDYGTGNDETRVYFADWSQLVIGSSGSIAMRLLERYADTLETGFILHLRLDIQALRQDNFCILENITA